MIARTAASAALLLAGCTQLVAFGEPVIGSPDIVEEEAAPGRPLCDAEIAVGERAGCDASCTIEPPRAAACPRVRALEGGYLVDVSGLHEVELNVDACARGGRPFRVTAENGASVAIEGGELVVRPARESAARPVRHREYVAEGACGERALVLQTGRMELAEGGIRLCSPHLVPVDGEWRIELGEVAERVELCFRSAEVPSGRP